MQNDTARLLIDSISNALNIAVDNRNKLAALDAVLEKHDLSLFQEYSDTLDKVRKHPPTVIYPEGFATLPNFYDEISNWC